METRKEKIRAYKDTPTPMGVFQIKNNSTGKILLVSAMNIPGIINSQRFQLRMDSHRNQELQNDWRQYGPQAFSFEVLETVNPEKVPREQWRDAVKALKEKWEQKLGLAPDMNYERQKEAAHS